MGKGIILLGTNLGDKSLNLLKAIEELKGYMNVISTSGVYETPAWGYQSEETYLNQAVLIQSDENPVEILRTCLNVEKKLGRIRNGRGYSDRTIDIDILLIDQLTIDSTELVLPHPRLHLRKFALLPLIDLWPNWLHPVLKKEVIVLLNECSDEVVPIKK